ncbi:electron transfer flavoprotein subunit alpha/FixB family protein [Oceanobacter mangrovi]|uniref:electron transfer flavoprotein subunit alpha/FixB family protein n=1 Tax=Oceanobacter mangrovi TaxID=2862510 RepID=UPI001C8D78CE|nr:FAD-binding protein [Oceanobacter mangrovi]
MSVLVVAEHLGGVLQSGTARVVAAALQMGDGVDVLVAGHNVSEVAEQAASLAGVRAVVVVDQPNLASQLAESVCEVVLTLVDSYSHLLAAASTFGKNLLPRVAGIKRLPQLSDVIEVISADTFKRPIYAGGAIATVQNTAPLKIITVRTSAFGAVGQAAAAAYSGVSVDVNNSLTSLVSETQADAAGPELGSARVVVSGGRGMGSKENFALIESLAGRLNAAVGASRAAVDAGYAANDLQVGQTGKIVAPELYVAVGISGAIQHLAGMKESRVIVAINQDEDAPIFKIADYGLKMDLFEALPQLESALS